MKNDLSPLQAAQEQLKSGAISVSELVAAAREQANSNAGKNVYLSIDGARAAHEAAALEKADKATLPLYGLPISIKDCFDVRGSVTNCGSKFYASVNAPSESDAWMTQLLNKSGAVIAGKTHMHQLAYGITGENADFGDCLQPDDATRLTGGSSSGAAASVQEGSAIAAIGTDTGGSVRVPSALCGLAGWRSSVGVGSWTGGVHLAESFDALGVLYRDSRDGPLLANALFGVGIAKRPKDMKGVTIAVVNDEFLQDADSVVLEGFSTQREKLLQAGATLREVDVTWWSDSGEIFSSIQAHEASRIQREKLAGRAGFEVFEPLIAERLAWGETITAEQIADLRVRHEAFRASMAVMLQEHDFLILPCAPMHELKAGMDHSLTRPKILRYTTPISLAAMPAVTLPQRNGAGVQLVAGRGLDSKLLAYAVALG
jgi:Asp-tRNA(Asn)/Glu-tRNA(Gln) amidotransferase A subunit family amidase